MRERTTWTRTAADTRQAATSRTADPYTMNQEHPQPPADAYVSGDPSAWAEDVHPANKTWEAEYAGGAVKRDEIGMPEMRADTFNHPEKTAAMKHEAAVKKAALAVEVARCMLPKNADEKTVEDQAVGLMNLPDSELVATYGRLAGGEKGVNPFIEQKKEEAKEEKKDDKKEEKKKEEKKEASDQTPPAQQAAQQQVGCGGMDQTAVQQMVQQMVQQALQQQAQQQPQAPTQQTAAQQDPQVQAQQQVPPVQQQAGEQPQQQVPPAAQQPQAPVADDPLLDEMLMDSPGDTGMSEIDIDMEPASMDTGEVQLGPEDEVLRSLFAQDDGQQQQEQEQQAPKQQEKQGSKRTAATRTVGTKPTGGVSRLGGQPAASASDVSKLENLWASAPDVSGVFGGTK